VTWAIVKPHSAWLAQAMDAWAAVEPHAPRARSDATSPPSTGTILPC